jgi:hypothetical protein
MTAAYKPGAVSNRMVHLKTSVARDPLITVSETELEPLNGYDLDLIGMLCAYTSRGVRLKDILSDLDQPSNCADTDCIELEDGIGGLQSASFAARFMGQPSEIEVLFEKEDVTQVGLSISRPNHFTPDQQSQLTKGMSTALALLCGVPTHVKFRGCAETVGRTLCGSRTE